MWWMWPWTTFLPVNRFVVCSSATNSIESGIQFKPGLTLNGCIVALLALLSWLYITSATDLWSPSDRLLLLSLPLLFLKEQISLKSAIWYLWNTKNKSKLICSCLGGRKFGGFPLHLVAELNRPLSVKNIVFLSLYHAPFHVNYVNLLFYNFACVYVIRLLCFYQCLTCWVGQEVLL